MSSNDTLTKSSTVTNIVTWNHEWAFATRDSAAPCCEQISRHLFTLTSTDYKRVRVRRRFYIQMVKCWSFYIEFLVLLYCLLIAASKHELLGFFRNHTNSYSISTVICKSRHTKSLSQIRSTHLLLTIVFHMEEKNSKIILHRHKFTNRTIICEKRSVNEPREFMIETKRDWMNANDPWPAVIHVTQITSATSSGSQQSSQWIWM